LSSYDVPLDGPASQPKIRGRRERMAVIGFRPQEFRRAGKAIPIKDSLIAATALVHGLTVVTRNRTDFANAGVRVVDPFVGG